MSLADMSRNHISQWMPDGVGYSTLTVINAIRWAAIVNEFLQ
jgi:penicillin-binding protein 1C